MRAVSAMTGIAHQIMQRVSVRHHGTWVCTPKDFLDLGSRAAVDQALSRLAKAGRLRRVDRGFYEVPAISNLLNRPRPTDLDAVVSALARRGRCADHAGRFGSREPAWPY